MQLTTVFQSPERNEEYPNSGFASYWKYLRTSVDIEGDAWYVKLIRGFQILAKLLVQVLRDAGIELLFLLAFVVIITKMSQGRDLIVSLFEPEGLYSSVRIAYTLLSALSLSASMWIIPAFLFQQRDRKNSHRRFYRSIFRRHLFFVHRLLPLLPFWLVAYALFNGPYTLWAFLLLSLVELAALFWFNHTVKEDRKVLRKAVIWGAIALLALAFTVFAAVLYRQTYLEAKYALAFILYLLSVVVFLLYHAADRRLLAKVAAAEVAGTNSVWATDPLNTGLYLGLLALHAGMLVVLFNVKRSFEIAPESMLLYIFSVYVFFIDLVAYWVNVSALRKAVATLAVLVVVLLYWSSAVRFNVSHYTIDSVASSSVLAGRERLPFSERFKILKDSMLADTATAPYPIVLVSGDGGGSRAGMWFSENLLNFEGYTNGRFRRHVFSLSTVSGSSVGLSTVFAYWDARGNDPRGLPWQDLPAKVYANNFVGSSVSGFLLTDIWKTLWPWPVEEDRNSILQREEAYYTQRAVNEIRQGTKAVSGDIPRGEQVLSNEFMGFFYDTAGGGLRFRADRPLVFINTCRSNDGRRGVISPVKLRNDVFHDAIDVAGYLYDTSVSDCFGKPLCPPHHRRNITLGQACNTSELFPLFSAPAYIDSLGSFVDGGYHENSGLKTTLDVYTLLRDTLRRDPVLRNKPYKIYIVYIRNGSAEKDLYKPLSSKTPLTLPLEALTNQPFQGSESYFEERAKFVDREDTQAAYVEVGLNYHWFFTDSANARRTPIQKQIFADLVSSIDTTKRDTVLNFPLARWLSKSVIGQIRKNAGLEINGSKNKPLKDLLDAIKNRGSRPGNPAAPQPESTVRWVERRRR